MTSAAQAEQAVHHTRDVLIGTLRLGVSLSAQHLVPFASYLGEFTRDHPGIDLRLQYAPALTMISMVGTGELDCLIGPAVSQVPGLRMTRLAREPLHLVCRADHRLAEQAEVTMRQLARSYLILLNRSHMPRSEACGHKIFLATNAKPGHPEERFRRSGSRTRIVTVTSD
jgi:DNA-binding transcriptional LysR family regulator